jgi:hypothetical protein
VSWGIVAIPRRPGETRRGSVERVYASGEVIELVDAFPQVRTLPGEPEQRADLTPADRRWMRTARGLLEEFRPGWEITTEEATSPVLENATAPLWVVLDWNTATFHDARSGQPDGEQWKFWWRTVRAFARIPATLFDPDTSEVVATSLSSADARERYRWM